MKIKICLNAGHSGKANRSPAIPEYYESEMAWKLHKYVGEELEKYNIDVIYTRNNINDKMTTIPRGQLAKDCAGYYSFHSNASGAVTNETVDYPLCIITTDSSNIRTLAGNIGAVIKEMMGTKQNNKVWTKLTNDGREWYGELRGCASVGVPGMIIEHGFHTNTKSTEWLMDDNNLKALAIAEATLIASYHGATKRNEQVKPEDGYFDITVKELKKGVTDESVRAVQRVLLCLGHDLGNSKDDGIFGDKTENAVKRFQLINRLPTTGEVDYFTYIKLMGLD